MGVCVYVYGYGYVYGLRLMVKGHRIPGDFFARFPEKNGRDFVDSQFSEFPLVCSQWTKNLKIWIKTIPRRCIWPKSFQNEFLAYISK